MYGMIAGFDVESVIFRIFKQTRYRIETPSGHKTGINYQIETNPGTSSNSTEPTDEELIARVRQRDEQALAAIYDRYHRLLYALALRITGDHATVEEVLQDTFHAVWRSVGGYQPGGSLAAWLIGIVRHRAIDATRSRLFQARVREHALDEATSEAAGSADDQIDHILLRQVVRAALSELSAEQRQAIDLAYYGGLTTAEVAARLGAPHGTVKSWIRQGITRLREALRRTG